MVSLFIMTFNQASANGIKSEFEVLPSELRQRLGQILSHQGWDEVKLNCFWRRHITWTRRSLERWHHKHSIQLSLSENRGAVQPSLARAVSVETIEVSWAFFRSQSAIIWTWKILRSQIKESHASTLEVGEVNVAKNSRKDLYLATSHLDASKNVLLRREGIND